MVDTDFRGAQASCKPRNLFWGRFCGERSVTAGVQLHRATNSCPHARFGLHFAYHTR